MRAQHQNLVDLTLKKDSRCRPFLGTFVEIEAAHNEDPVKAITSAFHEVSNVHQTLNFYDDKSWLSNLNKKRKAYLKDLPYDIAPLFKIIEELFLQSEGAFSPFVNKENKHVKLGYFPISYDASEVTFLEGNILLELGGVGKGFAVDLAIESLKNDGCKSGIVNAGGDTRVFGEQHAVHIRHTNTCIHLREEAIATSANDKDWTSPGAFWIQDPKGETLPKGTFSVKAPTCVVADALTKALSLGKREVFDYFKAKVVHAPI